MATNAYNEVDDLTDTNDNFFDTPELAVPASEPQAHRAVITSVTLKTISTHDDWPVIEIGVTSRDVPTFEDRLGIFIPADFDVALGSKFDPSTLPEGDGFWAQQQTMFRRNVANSEKTALLQQLVFNKDSVAQRAGRDPRELGINPRPATLEEYTDNLNKMLQGVEVIIKLRERGGDDPAFKHQLQVKAIVSADDYELNPKAYKKYQLAWEQ